MRALHTGVAGDSGSGKTTLLREMHAEFPGLSVWIDHTDAGGISGNDLEDATTVRSEAEARSATATRLRWRAESPPPVETIAAARRVALEFREETIYPAQVMLDESQEVLGEELEQGHPVKQMLHKDRDRGLKFVVATQDPTDWQPNYSAIKQAAYLTFVGVPSPFHEGFARYFSLPKGDFPGERFQYTVFEKGEAFNWTVAHRGSTSAEYA